jgi:hypothetical protein
MKAKWYSLYSNVKLFRSNVYLNVQYAAHLKLKYQAPPTITTPSRLHNNYF